MREEQEQSLRALAAKYRQQARAVEAAGVAEDIARMTADILRAHAADIETILGPGRVAR